MEFDVSKDSFIAYLLAQDEEDVAGVPASCVSCPIARWLDSQHEGVPVVALPEIVKYYEGGQTYYFDAEPWMTKFIDALDGLYEGEETVTVAEVLELLV